MKRQFMRTLDDNGNTVHWMEVTWSEHAIAVNLPDSIEVIAQAVTPPASVFDDLEGLESEWEILDDSDISEAEKNGRAIHIFKRALKLKRLDTTDEATKLALFALRCEIGKTCFNLTAKEVAKMDLAPPLATWQGPKSTQRRARTRTRA